MVQNPWLIFPQLCRFLTNCFTQSPHNFKAVFLIDRTTLWQELFMHHAIAIKETRSLGFLDAFIGMIGLWIQCHSHTPIIRHQLWSFWANLVRRWTSSTSPKRCFCSKFSNFGTIFAAARFMPKTSVKIAWHEPNEIPTLSATSLIVIRLLSKNIYFIALSLTSSRASLNRLYHNWTCVLLIVDSPNATVTI